MQICGLLTGFSTYNASLAHKIHTLLTVSEKNFDVLPV
jgi:hypothetical protein